VKYGEVLAFGSGGQSGVSRLVLMRMLVLGLVAMEEMEGTNMDV
jgi:hypothetical protein